MTNDTTKRITLPGAIATARFAFRAALTQLIAGGTPMTHSAFIEGDQLCIRKCNTEQAAKYAAALVAS